jgi:hypothetical protein
LRARAFTIAIERQLTNWLGSFAWLIIFLTVGGSFRVNTDESELPIEKLLQLLRDDQIDLAVIEGWRLVVAFNKIKDSSDRRMLIRLAERLGT